MNTRFEAYETNFNISLEDPPNCGCVDLHEHLSELFQDRCFLLNLVLNECYFRIKKIVLIQLDASLTPSFMHEAKYFGNIYLFIFYIIIIVKLLKYLIDFHFLLTLTYSQEG